MGNDTRQLSQAAIEAISSRLARLPDLRLPAQLRREGEPPASTQRRHDYLEKLLTHDPGVFLERHGADLAAGERREFEALRGDFEVNLYLNLLAEQEAGGSAKAATQSKNRRLAAMNRLLAEGRYFSEAEMRERAPGLHHQWVGQFRQPEVPQADDGCQAGCVLADSIMRQQEELDLRQRTAADQQRWRDAESESESEEDEEAAVAAGGAGAGVQPPPSQQQRQPQQGGGAAAAPAQAQAAPAAAQQQQQRQQQQQQQPQQQAEAQAAEAGSEDEDGAGAGAAEGGEEGGGGYRRISEAEQAENSAALLDAMQQRFLAGLDEGVDYAAIDADAELDEDWAEETRRDAEDAYFDGDD